ncbi:MAG: GNAT family N-acetyltransferase [Anaerolineae bacterium]|jgi:RimJ/RimL family protein N-acetyltransferase|nr:GNAT family N-acetyltransferase [Anaerolineae bacterium]
MDLKSLFPTYTQNYLADAIIEGTFGEICTDDDANPHVAVLNALNGKLHIFGGDAAHPAAREYVSKLSWFTMLLVGADGWKELFYEVLAGKVLTFPRHAFSSKSLDPVHLKSLRERLSSEFTIEKLTLERMQMLAANKEKWREDQFFGFTDAEDFLTRGIGYCALHGDQVVCLATSGAACSRGIEVQVDTHPNYYRRGLATAACAALLSDCLAQGIDPNWDAANPDSAGLACKLGYTQLDDYDMYYNLGSKFLMKLRTFLRRIRGKE